ncbi:ribosomal RNA processing protein 36 homolog [Myotis lucifugus]|uniref:ribosomal RNA processing protein 36 homolog n=1 Tax=Myotis lucifugus TaxID=59463 RepID=UPI0003C45507|nr:ribosomal RNA processing protein 36 homolog [Myotis lucifugus]
MPVSSGHVSGCTACSFQGPLHELLECEDCFPLKKPLAYILLFKKIWTLLVRAVRADAESEVPRRAPRRLSLGAGDSGDGGGGPRKDTSHMSFEELLELQSQVGTKTYKQLVAGSSTKKQGSRPPVQNACVADKHRPLEMSAKVRVPFLRQVVPISKKVARDPRFDDLSGEYNPEVFDKTYQFLNDIRAKEKELVKKQLKKHRSGEKHEKLQQLLQRMEQQEMAQQERKRQQELRLALKQERRAQAQQGHRPYFLKKSEQRQLVLAEKFKELKRSKKLDSFLSRKRRRNAGKDRRHLPLNKD